MSRTKIEWATDTWNPVSGCTPVSPGCAHCYAKRRAETRLRGMFGYPADEPFRVTLHPERLEEPLRWKKPRRIFVCSMGDLFHEQVPDTFIPEVFGVMAVASEKWHGPGDGAEKTGEYRMPYAKHGPHTFLVLTKRPQRMRALLTDYRFRIEVAKAAYRHAMDRRCAGTVYESISGLREDDRASHIEATHWPLPNVWLGTSVENQDQILRVDELLSTPAAIHFASFEPLLGPVNLKGRLVPKDIRGGYAEVLRRFPTKGPIPQHLQLRHGLDWVIAGGESGPGARPMHPDWVRGLRDQCQAAGVPFLFKQWGEWHESDLQPAMGQAKHLWPDGKLMYRVGKNAAGRLLDGRIWDEYPTQGGERS